jgi:hypothetical protein
MRLTASETLKKSRFFLDRARKAARSDRDAFGAFLEAAIVFSRSVTFHLQKELSGRPGFEEWYPTQQARLAQNAESRFLLEQRNYLLKEGPLQARRIVSVTGTASITITASASIRVIRGDPWYRRSPKVLWEDATRPFKAKMRRRAERRRQMAAAAERRKRQAEEASKSKDEMYFVGSEWSQKPALEMVSDHLKLLAQIVDEATRHFAESPNKTMEPTR